MDVEELKAMIPSETVRKYILETGWSFTDMQKAALLYHSDLLLQEQYSRLMALRNATADEELRTQLTEYLEKQERAFQVFKENKDRRCIYILLVEEYYDGDQKEWYSAPTEAYFFDWETALYYGKKEKTPFQIKKHLVDDVAASERQEYEIRSTDEVSGIRFNSNGEASGLWSSEIPFDAETDGYFSYVFYEVPNPFDAGDVVRLVGTEDYGIVEVSQKQWNDDLVKWKNPEWLQKGLYVDYSDVQIRVIFLCEDGTFSHSHINPVDLELYRPDQDSQDPVDSARDQLLQAASLLYRKDDSSSVIGSLEDLYVYTMKYRNAKGAEN